MSAHEILTELLERWALRAHHLKEMIEREGSDASVRRMARLKGKLSIAQQIRDEVSECIDNMIREVSLGE